MAQSSQVPTFGNWEAEEDVPYTAYFDNAGKSKKGDKLNPNDRQDLGESETPGQKGSNEHAASQDDSESRRSVDSPLHSNAIGLKATVNSSLPRQSGPRSGGHKSEVEAPKSSDGLRAKHERQPSREESDIRRQTDSPMRHESAVRKSNYDSPRHSGLSAGDTPRRATRQSVGSDRSVEHSPLHPQLHAKIGGKGTGVSSPSWERKGSSEGSHGLAPSTPGRSRLRSVTRGDDTQPDQGPAVPKFGDWDESDPAAAEGYTHIFNRVREEKQTGAGKVPAMPNDASFSNGQKRDGYDNSKNCWCIPWGRR